MTDMIFLKILDMSLNGCIAVAFVLIARLFLKKSPKIYSYVIWLIVLFRLVCPFSIESQTGIAPSVNEPVTTERYTVVRSAVRSGLAGGAGQYTAARDAVKTISWVTVGKYVWLVGLAALLIYGLISMMRLRKELKNAVMIEDEVYSANIEEPFVMGVVRPKIYMPNKLDVRERK